MAETTPKRRVWRLVVGVLVGVCLLFGALGMAWYLRSPEFEDLVRRRVIAALEGATGGRVEMQAFHWNLSRLEFEADNVTVHGLEPLTQAPLAHVDTLRVRAHVLSVLRTQVDLTYIGIERPQVHLVIQPDGTNNVPEPKIKSNTDTIQQLFDLAIGKAEVRDGVLLINDRKLPLDFTANDVVATSSYDRRDKRYDANLRAGKIDAKVAEYREVPAQVEAEFSLWQNRAQVKSLKLQSQRSSLEVSGTIKDLNKPDVQLSYSSTVDLPQASAIARIANVRQGTANITGSATYSADRFATSGKLAVSNFDYVGDGLQLHNVKMSSDFAADNTRLQLKKIAARLLNGDVSGDAEINNYLGAAALSSTNYSNAEPSRRAGLRNAGHVAQAPRQQGAAHLKLSGISLPEVTHMMSSRSLPLERAKLAGSASGKIDLSWQDSLSRARAEMALDFSAPQQTAADQLPVAGNVVGSFDMAQQLLELRPLVLTTPHSRMNAAGRVGSQTAALAVNLASSDLNDFEGLLNAFGGSRFPVDLAGQASFDGSLSGSLRNPDVKGRAQLSDFTYLYTPSAIQVAPVRTRASATDVPAPAPAATTVKRIHFDWFAGDIEYSNTNVALHHAVIKRVDATVNLDASATLQKGSFTDASPFQVQARVESADLTRLQEIAGINYPVSGKVDLALHASGTKGTPSANAKVAVTSGQAYGRAFDSLVANIDFNNGEAQFRNVVLKAPGATITGAGAYNLNTRQMKADLHGSGVELAKLPEAQWEKLSTAGEAEFDLKASGTPEEPVLNAHLQIDKLVLNDEHIGDLALDAVTQGKQLEVTGRSNFQHASLALDGTVQMHGEMPADLNVQFANLDIDPFLTTEMKGRITGHSAIEGRAHLAGPLREPRDLAGKLTVDAFHVEVEKIPIKSDGPIELVLANQTLSVEHLVMTSSDTRLTVGGSIDLKGERRLDLRADGSINLVLLQTFDPDLTSTGTAKLNVVVNGTVANPLMTGRVDVAHLGLSNIDLPAALAEVNGSLVFNQDRLEIEKLTGHIGGGFVNFAGYITYANTIGFNITSEGTDIRFRYAGISVTANQELKVQGTLKNATVSGDITITRFAQIPSSDLAAVFANPPSQVPNAASPLNNLHLELRIVSAPELTVQTSLAKLSGDADLRVRGTALRPVLLGRINIAQGDIKLNGTKYYLERGDITFANPVRIDPILDVEATTQVRDYDITIGLHGTMERLLTTYRSDPPLSSDDIISLLAFGRTQQESSSGAGGGGSFSGGFGEAASSAVLGAAINQAVSNRVSRLFGVSAIRINPAAGGPDNNPNARLTVEQQVSSDVTITYITNLARSAQQVIQFEYNIKRDYTINAIRDENGVLSFDLLIRKRKK